MAKAGIHEEAEKFRDFNQVISNDLGALKNSNRNYANIRDCIDKYYIEPELPL
jgi:hypothetical protein